MIVKSMDPALLRRRSGAQSVALAAELAEVADIYDRMEDVSEPNLMIQEYIPGTPDHSWMFNGYFDAHSDCRVAFTGQKIRQFPRDTGATTLGVSRQNDEVVETTKTLMKQLAIAGSST